MSLVGDRVDLQLAPVPSTGTRRIAARTVQGAFLPESFHKGHQVGSVTVWTETNQISSEAFRALDAMANTEWCHGTYQSTQVRFVVVANAVGILISIADVTNLFPKRDL
jgi:hypothetical protein